MWHSDNSSKVKHAYDMHLDPLICQDTSQAHSGVGLASTIIAYAEFREKQTLLSQATPAF